MRWRWPPESVTPRSPRAVSRPRGRRSSTSSAAAICSAQSSSSSLAPGAARRRLAARVSENRKLSCGTTCTRRRRASSWRSRTSRQPSCAEPTSTCPAWASARRGSRLASRLLPAPVPPTRATTSPGSMRSEQRSRMLRPPPGALTLTSRRRSPSGPVGSGAAPPTIAGRASSNCQMRSAEERASAKTCMTRPTPSMRNTRVVAISSELTSSPTPRRPSRTSRAP
ncbi:hypothetical protein D9M69_407140 [compost metagenome]